MAELIAGQVTIADLYRELSGMRTDVGKALTKLEVIDNRNVAADRLHNDHENRLRSLESFRWKLTGVALAVGAIAGVLGGTLSAHVH